MLNVAKYQSGNGTDVIDIKKTENESFKILFAGNFDLYFIYDGSDKGESHSIDISKENSFLYERFSKLYDSILNEDPFECDDSSLLYRHSQFPNSLLKDGIIEWHSDDAFYDEASVLYIEKLDDAFRITIKNGLISDIRIKTTSVRIRNSGSIYAPYNAPFMSLYRDLCKHNFNNEQITMDEYVYSNFTRKR